MKLNTLNRHIVTLGALAAAIVLTLPTGASAQRGAGGGARGGMFNNPGVRMWTLIGDDLEKFTEDLTLTDAQTESMNALLADFREKNEDGLERYAGLRARMEAARGGGGGGGGARGAMQGVMQEYRQVMETLGPVLEKLHEDFGELLDEDQTKKLAELLRPRRPGG
ncbi:MAG: hypothetical protein F4187_03445 [Gemmatimonadetes bacterium]|nr:hypothetical protein [Gemmatimonadota bacterium]